VLTYLDIYIACVSSAHNVCPKGYWIAIVSTIAESSANHHIELQPGIDRLGKIEEQFMVRIEQRGRSLEKDDVTDRLLIGCPHPHL
jgi:RAB protein geranylgeranyltransferase component A